MIGKEIANLAREGLLSRRCGGRMAEPPLLRGGGQNRQSDSGVPPHVADKILDRRFGTISGVAAVY
jgi:hypothetical protein